MKMLHLSTDEMGVLGTAAFLSGENWSGIVKNIPYYGYGQAILYIPVFWMTQNPDLRFLLMGIENSIILSFIPVIIYIITGKYFDFEKKDSILTAICVGLFPSYTSYTKWLWNETMLSILPVLCLFIILLLLKNRENIPRKRKLSFLLSLCTVYSFAVHGRGLGIIVAVLLLIIYIRFYFKEKFVDYLSLSLGYLLGCPCYIFIKNYLTKNLWLLEEGKSLNNTTANIVPSLKRMFNVDYILGNFRIIMGQFYTACMSSCGLLLLFLITLFAFYIGKIRKKNENSEYGMEEHITYVFSLLMFICAYAISITAVSASNLDPNSRGDYPIYIRYYSHTLGLIIFSVLLMFQKLRIKYTYHIISLLGLILISFVTIWKIASFINSGRPISNATIMNILPFIGSNPPDYVRRIDFISLSIITLVIFIIICFLHYFKNKIYVPQLLVIVFLFVYYFNATKVILPNNQADYQKTVVPKEVMAKIDWMAPYPKCYYFNLRKPWSDSMLQFSLPQFQVENTTVERIEQFKINDNSIIISTEDLKLEILDDSFYRINDELLNTGIDFMWVYGEDLKLFVESNSDLDFDNAIN